MLTSHNYNHSIYVNVLLIAEFESSCSKNLIESGGTPFNGLIWLCSARKGRELCHFQRKRPDRKLTDAFYDGQKVEETCTINSS